MKANKTIALIAAAIILSGCIEAPETVLDSGASNNSSDSLNSLSSPTAEVGENGSVYDIPENAFELDLSHMDHLKQTENTKIGKSIPDGIYETDVSYVFNDLNQLRDKLGKVYLGDSYNSSCWENAGQGTQELSKYVSEDFKGEFQVDNYGKLVFVDDKKNLQPFFSKGEIFDDGSEYLLADGSSISYAEAVRSADRMMKGYDSVLGKVPSPAAKVIYNQDTKVIIVDYFQKVHGLSLCKINEDVDLNDTDYDQLNLAWGASFTKQVFIFGSGENDALLVIKDGEIDTPDRKKYEKLITLQSVMDKIDNQTAEYLDFEVLTIDLKYYVRTSAPEKSSEVINVKFTGTVPVWEIVLKDTKNTQEYTYVVDALNGDTSFMKLNEVNANR